ncbi:hypothetical protein A1O1_07838 [Capronia coronata CBS 617.96]|uniref:CHAT domain-containing protein n=1 Tax=Capronia coronata CBS 617.96 TaxID=1182541 RepID=W9XNF8_9EURO|nr:uncharacterized protein A1O1_07838 [Capronia coronata CBS 617.96]EXJ81773.1 hypothetical protein A1O1_07838 [Capronia coronata CBS 617.96]
MTMEEEAALLGKVDSTETVAALAQSLSAKFLHGLDLFSDSIRDAVAGSSIFHHHGHVLFKAKSALDLALALEATKGKEVQTVTVRDMFRWKLSEVALIGGQWAIIGCCSGMMSISSADDILGLPTTMFHAGASSVVSAL